MKTAAFALQVSIVVLLLAASSAPTPVYAAWQAQWGFSALMVTVVFGAYALAVLASLLVFGSLSDHVGRTPVLFTALVVQLVAIGLFATAGGVGTLLFARVLQGLSTGAAVAALGAGLLDLHRERGAVANAVAPMSGTALGSLGSAAMVQYLPAPTQLVFWVIGGGLVLQTAAVAFMSESAQRRPGAWGSLKPRIRLPAAARGAFTLVTPAMIAAWAVPGFYGSLGPALLRGFTGQSSPLLGGLALFVLGGSGAIAILLTLDRPPQRVLMVGSAALALGTAISLLGISTQSLSVFIAGAIVTGSGFGLAFQGGIRSVVPYVAAHERAGVFSLLLIVAYLSFGIPAVLAGLRVAHAGVISTAIEYSVVVILLAAISLVRALPSSTSLERTSP